MPKGFHYGHSQFRPYTQEYYRISAISFKSMLDARLGQYKFSNEKLSKEHCTFELAISNRWSRILVFTIKGREHAIPLQLDNRSASNKLYFLCPYCHHQRVHLYAVKNAYSCRKCLGLHYGCQSERPMERLARRILKLRRALWGSFSSDIGDLMSSCNWWPKPKGVHTSRFERERAVIIKLEEKYFSLTLPIIRSMLGTVYDPFGD